MLRVTLLPLDPETQMPLSLFWLVVLSVTVFAADGTPLGGFGPVGTGDGQIAFPAGIALDGAGSVYVMDSDPASARLMKVRLVPPLVP